MITSNARLVRERRAKSDRTQNIAGKYDLDDSLLTLGVDEEEIDNNLTLDEKWAYISHRLHTQFLEEEASTNRALRTACLRGDRPRASFKNQTLDENRIDLPKLPQICTLCGAVIKELIQFFRQKENKCCPNLKCGYPIITASLPYQHSVIAYLFHYSIGEPALHDTGLFTIHRKSTPMTLSQLLPQTHIRIQGGGAVKPWLAPAVNGVLVDKSWTMIFDCVDSGLKVEISNEDVVKVLKDTFGEKHGRTQDEDNAMNES